MKRGLFLAILAMSLAGCDPGKFTLNTVVDRFNEEGEQIAIQEPIQGFDEVVSPGGDLQTYTAQLKENRSGDVEKARLSEASFTLLYYLDLPDASVPITVEIGPNSQGIAQSKIDGAIKVSYKDSEPIEVTADKNFETAVGEALGEDGPILLKQAVDSGYYDGQKWSVVDVALIGGLMALDVIGITGLSEPAVSNFSGDEIVLAVPFGPIVKYVVVNAKMKACADFQSEDKIFINTIVRQASGEGEGEGEGEIPLNIEDITPNFQRLNAGQPFTITVKATGYQLTYQWYKLADDGSLTPITGATSETYHKDVVMVGDAGDYVVTVTDGYGTKAIIKK